MKKPIIKQLTLSYLVIFPDGTEKEYAQLDSAIKQVGRDYTYIHRETEDVRG